MDGMEGKIVLDRRSFEALAVDSRVRILKSLRERRKTLSEISKEQKMSLSGVKEHLETLEGVGLIKKIDDGHKWKYYELTRKGMDIVAPRELRVWILLSLSTIALVASMFVLFSPSLEPVSYQATAVSMDRVAEPAPAMAAEYAEAADAAEAPKANEVSAGGEAPVEQEQPEPLPAVPLAVAGISAVTLVACLAILARNRLTSL